MATKTKKTTTKKLNTSSSSTTSSSPFRFIATNNTALSRINAPSYSYWQTLFKSLIKKKVFLISLFIFLLLVCLAYFANIGKSNASILQEGDDYRTAKPPNSDHIFGTYIKGQDLWSVLWLGTSTTLSFAFLLAAFEIVLGLIIGGIWGFFQKLDIFFIQLISLFSLVPSLMFFIIIALFMGHGFWSVVVAVMITAWIGFSTITRNNINYVKHTEYNSASILLGTPWYKILVNNILPHIMPILLQSIAFMVPSAIGTDMVVSFLRFDFVDPTVSPFIEGEPSISLGFILQKILSGTYIQSADFAFLVWIPLGTACLLSISSYLVMKDIADLANPKTHR